MESLSHTLSRAKIEESFHFSQSILQCVILTLPAVKIQLKPQSEKAATPVSPGKPTENTTTPEPQQSTSQSQCDYVLNTNTKKFHLPSCSSADDIKATNRKDYNGSRDDLIAWGYVPCKRCSP